MLLTGLRGVSSEEDFERFAELSMHVWEGRSEDELSELARDADAILTNWKPVTARVLESAPRRTHQSAIRPANATRAMPDNPAGTMRRVRPSASVSAANAVNWGRVSSP